MTDGVPGIRLLPWWERWPGLLEWELAQFEKWGLPAKVASDPRQGADRLVVHTSLSVGVRGEILLIVVYPDGFPDRRFAIFAPELKLPRHQAFGGNLCVMPRESIHWNPWFSAGQIIAERVPRLIDLVDRGGDALREAEDPQGEPLTTYYETQIQGGVIFDDRVLTDALQAAGGGTLDLRMRHADATWLRPPPDPLPPAWAPHAGLMYLAGASDYNGAPLVDPAPEAFCKGFPVPGVGAWTYISAPPYATTANDLWDHLVESDSAVRSWCRTNTGPLVLGMCTREEVRQGEYQIAWVFLSRRVEEIDQSKGAPGRRRSGDPAKQRVQKAGPAVFVRGLRRTEEALAARIPELNQLRSKTVTVIGLGSLGAPLAQELAKARLGKLRLVDPDYIDPATAVRYPLGLADAGINKALALATWVASNHPDVGFSMHPIVVGATPLASPTSSERDQMSEALSGADLVISATAEHDVNREIDTYARELGVPRMYLWSQSGFGGVVALLTAETGCYHCLEVMLSEAALSGSPVVQVPPDVADGIPAGTIQSPGCADKTFTSPHADLLPISIQAARVAYGHLSAGSDSSYPAMRGPVFSVQVRGVDGTAIPPAWTVHSLEKNPKCRNCTG